MTQANEILKQELEIIHKIYVQRTDEGYVWACIPCVDYYSHGVWESEPFDSQLGAVNAASLHAQDHDKDL